MLLDDVSHGNSRGGVVEERMPIVHKKAKINSLESCASKSEDPSTVEVFVAGGVKKRKRSKRIPAAASFHRQEDAVSFSGMKKFGPVRPQEKQFLIRPGRAYFVL
jgi:hypothetical protein